MAGREETEREETAREERIGGEGAFFAQISLNSRMKDSS